MYTFNDHSTDDSTFSLQKTFCELKRNTVYMLSGGQIYLEVVF